MSTHYSGHLGGLGMIAQAVMYKRQKGKKERKRKKRRTEVQMAQMAFAMQVQHAENYRVELGRRLQFLNEQNKRLRDKVLGELGRASSELSSVVELSAAVKDEGKSLSYLQQHDALEQEIDALRAQVMEQELSHQVGNEPASFYAEELKKAQFVTMNYRAVWRDARAAWTKAKAMGVRARKVLKQQKEEEEARRRQEELEARRQEEAARRKAIEERQAEAAKRRREIEEDYRKRREAMLARYKATTPSSLNSFYPPEALIRMESSMSGLGERSYAPILHPVFSAGVGNPCAPHHEWVSDPPGGPHPGLSGWFSDMFSDKDKKRKKRAERAAQEQMQAAMMAQAAAHAQAEAEKAERLFQRRRAQLRALSRDVNSAASETSVWIDRINRLAENPLLEETPRLVEDALTQVSKWEATVAEIQSGLGEIDLGIEEPKDQAAFVAELAAARSAIRTIATRAGVLHRRLEDELGKRTASESRLANLITQQQALDAREKALANKAAQEHAQRELEARTFQARRSRLDAMQAEQNAIRELAKERDRLAVAKQELKRLQRTASLKAKLGMA